MARHDIGQRQVLCLRVYMDREGVKLEVHKVAKEDRGQYPAILTEQA